MKAYFTLFFLFIRGLWSRLTAWVNLWPDYLAEALGILLFLATAPLFSWVAGWIGGTEAAILQNILIVALEIPVINLLAFLGILFNFKVVFDWYKKKHVIGKDWHALTSWQRWTVFLALYISFLFSAVLLFASLQ